LKSGGRFTADSGVSGGTAGGLNSPAPAVTGAADWSDQCDRCTPQTMWRVAEIPPSPGRQRDADAEHPHAVRQRPYDGTGGCHAGGEFVTRPPRAGRRHGGAGRRTAGPPRGVLAPRRVAAPEGGDELRSAPVSAKEVHLYREPAAAPTAPLALAQVPATAPSPPQAPKVKPRLWPPSTTPSRRPSLNRRRRSGTPGTPAIRAAPANGTATTTATGGEGR